MIRKFNYTKRKNIKRSEVSINILNKDDKPESLEVKLNLETDTYPPDATIYLVAEHKTERKRFSLGTVKEPQIPYLSVEDMAYNDYLHFRLLLVNETQQNGLIVAHADNLTAGNQNIKYPILPYSTDDLDYLLWKIDFDNDTDGPMLIVNRTIPNIDNIVKHDSTFFVTVFPAIIREILMYMVFVDKVADVNEPEIQWHANWLQFCKKVAPSSSIPDCLDPSIELFDETSVNEWINQVIASFCSKYNSHWTNYINKITGNPND